MINILTGHVGQLKSPCIFLQQYPREITLLNLFPRYSNTYTMQGAGID